MRDRHALSRGGEIFFRPVRWVHRNVTIQRGAGREKRKVLSYREKAFELLGKKKPAFIGKAVGKEVHCFLERGRERLVHSPFHSVLVGERETLVIILRKENV